MVGTLALARLVAQAEQAGAAVRLLGDHRQLTAVEAGGRCGCWRTPWTWRS